MKLSNKHIAWVGLLAAAGAMVFADNKLIRKSPDQPWGDGFYGLLTSLAVFPASVGVQLALKG